jgi:hypothetical protein
MAGGVPGVAAAVFSVVGGAASDRYGKKGSRDALR